MTKLISLGILIIFFLSIGCSKQNDAADPASVQPNDATAFSERNNQTVFQNDSQNFFNQTNPFNESNQYENNQRETNYKTVTMNDNNLNVPFAMIQIPETWTASSDIRWINSDPYVIYKVVASDMSNTESFAFYSYMKTGNYISPESFFRRLRPVPSSPNRSDGHNRPGHRQAYQSHQNSNNTILLHLPLSVVKRLDDRLRSLGFVMYYAPD